jgi:hypothetical protein
MDRPSAPASNTQDIHSLPLGFPDDLDGFRRHPPFTPWGPQLTTTPAGPGELYSAFQTGHDHPSNSVNTNDANLISMASANAVTYDSSIARGGAWVWDAITPGSRNPDGQPNADVGPWHLNLANLDMGPAHNPALSDSAFLDSSVFQSTGRSSGFVSLSFPIRLL